MLKSGVLMKSAGQSQSSKTPGLPGVNVLATCREVLLQGLGTDYLSVSHISQYAGWSKCLNIIEDTLNLAQDVQAGMATTYYYTETKKSSKLNSPLMFIVTSVALN